jgi:hypothetical protein
MTHYNSRANTKRMSHISIKFFAEGESRHKEELYWDPLEYGLNELVLERIQNWRKDPNFRTAMENVGFPDSLPRGMEYQFGKCQRNRKAKSPYHKWETITDQTKISDILDSFPSHVIILRVKTKRMEAEQQQEKKLKRQVELNGPESPRATKIQKIGNDNKQEEQPSLSGLETSIASVDDPIESKMKMILALNEIDINSPSYSGRTVVQIFECAPIDSEQRENLLSAFNAYV